MSHLLPPEKLAGAICRLRLEFPYELEGLLDERQIRDHYAPAFHFQLAKNRLGGQQARLGTLGGVESLGPYELLELYWRTKNRSDEELTGLLGLAEEILDVHPASAGDQPGHLTER